jgi:hypothetical protein
MVAEEEFPPTAYAPTAGSLSEEGFALALDSAEWTGDGSSRLAATLPTPGESPEALGGAATLVDTDGEGWVCGATTPLLGPGEVASDTSGGAAGKAPTLLPSVSPDGVTKVEPIIRPAITSVSRTTGGDHGTRDPTRRCGRG